MPQQGTAGWQKILYVMVAAQLLSAVGFSMIFPFLPRYVEFLGSTLNLNLVFLVGAVFYHLLIHL